MNWLLKNKPQGTIRVHPCRRTLLELPRAIGLLEYPLVPPDLQLGLRIGINVLRTESADGSVHCRKEPARGPFVPFQIAAGAAHGTHFFNNELPKLSCGPHVLRSMIEIVFGDSHRVDGLLFRLEDIRELDALSDSDLFFYCSDLCHTV